MRKVRFEYGVHKCGETEFYLIDCETGVKIDTYDRWGTMLRECQKRGWELIEIDELPMVDTSEEDQKTLEAFQHWLKLICGRFGVEVNGCFSIAIAGRDGPESESDTDVIRNIEHVSKSGVVRTTSRGNRP